MKWYCVVLLMYLLQISAYYDDVQDAVYSVRDSFGILMTDVQTDMRNSIDCTLLTIRRINYDETLSNRRPCREGTSPYYPQPQSDYFIPAVDPVLSNELTQRNQLAKTELDRNIDDAKSEINDTIYEFINRHAKMDRYEGETMSQLESISNENVQLKQNIDTLTDNIHKQLEKVELTRNNETMKILLKEMQLLHNEEKNSINTTFELHRVIADVLQEINKTQSSNNTTESDKFQDTVLRLEKESNSTYDDIEKRFEKWQIFETKRLDEIKALLEKQKNSTQHATDAKSFKDIDKVITTESPSLVYPRENKFERVLELVNVGNNETSNITEIMQIQKPSPHIDITSTSTVKAISISPNVSTTSIEITTITNNAIATRDANFTTKTSEASTPKVLELFTVKQIPTIRDKITTILSTTVSPLTFDSSSTTESENDSNKLNDYDAFFDSVDEKAKTDAIKSAANLIEESEKSQSVFDKLFNNLNFG